MRLAGRSTGALVACGLLATGTLITAQRGPAPPALHIDPLVLAQACAPRLAYEPPMASLQITGGQDSTVRRTHAPGDLVTVNAGTDNGIDVGQEYYVRRVLPMNGRRPTREQPAVTRTTGWIRIYAVDKKMSLATIEHACETVDIGDYLEPFALPTVPAPQADAPRPQKENYGRILVGADRRRSFGNGDFFIVDRGSDHGVTPGSLFVVYHDKHQDRNYLYELGEAVAVEVRPESSTLRAILSRDAFSEGDYVALRK